MAGLTWILSLLCVSGGHLSSASPVLRSALVVQAGQSVSLTCNLTSSGDVTWYHLRSDQPLPLLTVRSARVGGETVNFHAADTRRISSRGALENSSLALEVLEVEERDAGLYFCTGRCAGDVCVNRGVRLAVNGVDGQPARQPCWVPGICVLLALLVLCVVTVVGFCLCSGKPAVCCCGSMRSSRSLKGSEDESLQYSSLRLAAKPRPSGRGGTGLAEEDVTYSTVSSGNNPSGSRDLR
ncbi:uncharacterized protein LOC121619638 [Chelmon rostratus]|uniref:uncharacterized protein LOC121619638 n=1 Tax=Chelmon rostratus TaxID=109905 RepID=UPI001BE83169|nr:uncharacterized protein LOC121619638 [Chelmon rostratus]